MFGSLPTGRRGQALALGLLAITLAVLWLVVVGPLIGWYSERADRLARERVLAARMAEIAASLPLLEQQATARRGTAPKPDALLAGNSDALAAAALQERLQAMAQRSGAALSTIEALPPEASGAYRRIKVRATLAAPYPALTQLLRGISTAAPTMLVDDLTMRASFSAAPDQATRLETSFTVIAFRSASP